MAVTKAERLERRARVLAELRGPASRWPRPRVELTLQRGRRRPRVVGRVRRVATSGAFVLLAVGDDVPPDASIGERAGDGLHVPVDVIRSVRYP